MQEKIYNNKIQPQMCTKSRPSASREDGEEKEKQWVLLNKLYIEVLLCKKNYIIQLINQFYFHI